MDRIFALSGKDRHKFRKLEKIVQSMFVAYQVNADNQQKLTKFLAE